jgi:hypothetical protein
VSRATAAFSVEPRHLALATTRRSDGSVATRAPAEAPAVCDPTLVPTMLRFGYLIERPAKERLFWLCSSHETTQQ